jgi:TPR repeat protein
LANLVLEGAGAPEDPSRIAGWFKQAAAEGDLIAAYNLGVCLVKGVGVAQDEQQAAQWLRRAADGVADAQYMYGRMLAEGRGVPPDLRSARTWFTRAADAGVPDAQVALAEMMVNAVVALLLRPQRNSCSRKQPPKAIPAQCLRSARCSAGATIFRLLERPRSAGSAQLRNRATDMPN